MSDDELLEYEIEPEAAQEIQTVPVCVTEPVVTIETVPHHAIFRTFVLTTTDPYLQILPIDPLRVTATVTSLDQDVVLCNDRAQAQDSANADTTLARPNGAVLSHQAGLPVPTVIPSVDEVWVAGNTFPSRVAVIVARRLP